MSTCHLTEWSYKDGVLRGKVVKDHAGISVPGEYVSVTGFTEINETPIRTWFMTRHYQYIVVRAEENHNA